MYDCYERTVSRQMSASCEENCRLTTRDGDRRWRDTTETTTETCVRREVSCPTYVVQLGKVGLGLAHVRAEEEGGHVALLLQVVDDVTHLNSELDADSQALTRHVRAHLHEEEAGGEAEQEHDGEDTEEEGDSLLLVEVTTGRCSRCREKYQYIDKCLLL